MDEQDKIGITLPLKRRYLAVVDVATVNYAGLLGFGTDTSCDISRLIVDLVSNTMPKDENKSNGTVEIKFQYKESQMRVDITCMTDESIYMSFIKQLPEKPLTATSYQL